MKTSRTKFIVIFVVSALAFIFITKGVLNEQPEDLLGTSQQTGWQSVVSTIISPVKIVLLGPLQPFISFLRQDPDTPPPFFLIGFITYWSLLAFAIHYIAGRIKASRLKAGH